MEAAKANYKKVLIEGLGQEYFERKIQLNKFRTSQNSFLRYFKAKKISDDAKILKVLKDIETIMTQIVETEFLKKISEQIKEIEKKLTASEKDFSSTVYKNLQNRVIQQLKLNGLERSLTKMFKDSENLTEVKDETDNLTAQLEDIKSKILESNGKLEENRNSLADTLDKINYANQNH